MKKQQKDPIVMLTQKLNLNDNTHDALQEIFDHIQSQDTVQGLKEISESILNAFMLKDRNAFLRTAASEDNKGNGYYNRTLSTLKVIKDFDAALTAFKNLCQKYADKYPHFIEHRKNRAERYLTFLKYPQSVQKHIYTTNVAENINSRLEVLRINLGGYFQSTKTLSVAIQVLVDKLHAQRWLKSLPAFMEAEYEICQLFGQRFEMKI
jgi:transposase-like protein